MLINLYDPFHFSHCNNWEIIYFIRKSPAIVKHVRYSHLVHLNSKHNESPFFCDISVLISDLYILDKLQQLRKLISKYHYLQVNNILSSMLSTLVVAVDMFLLFKDCNFLADVDNTFSFSSLLVMFLSCLWELHY